MALIELYQKFLYKFPIFLKMIIKINNLRIEPTIFPVK